MIVAIAIALLAIAYRVRMRLFTKAEFVVLSIFVVNWVTIELQITICDHILFPEKRYWVQSGVLLLGWTAWGIYRFSSALSSRFRLARYVLPAAVACLAGFEVLMIMKPHIPGSRRYAYLQAVDWAAERIRADWKGPAKDEHLEYVGSNYRRPNRPVVHAHTARLPYVLNGRRSLRGDESVCDIHDIPDYICDEEKNIDLAADWLHGARYELMDRLTVGKRTFALYRRREGGGPAR